MNWREMFYYKDGILMQKKVYISNQYKQYWKDSDRVAPYHFVDGYKRIKILGKHYSHHRIIWELFNGVIPDNMQIDHIDGDRSNNNIENLRLVLKDENSRNRRISKNNTSGYHGIVYDKRYEGKIQAYISNKGKRETIYSGYDFFEAMCRRKSKEIEYGYHRNHGH